MSAPRIVFIHTLDFLPARWNGKRLVCSGRTNGAAQSYRSLRTLTKHVAADDRARRKSRGKKRLYGWCEVEVPS